MGRWRAEHCYSIVTFAGEAAESTLDLWGCSSGILGMLPVALLAFPVQAWHSWMFWNRV